MLQNTITNKIKKICIYFYKEKTIELIVGIGLLTISSEALAAFDLNNFGKAVFEPTQKFVDSYYPVAIFTTGIGGAFMQRDGDLRERSIGFAKGAVFGGLAVLGTKAMFGI